MVSEVTISTTNRPYSVGIDQVCSEDGYINFGIDAEQVDLCVAYIMNVLQDYSADVVITAVGIVFTMMMRRFEFQLPSYLGFIDAFLKGDDYKLRIHAFEIFLRNLYERHLTRYERINFKPRTIRF